MDEPHVALIEPDRVYRRYLSEYLRAHGIDIIELEGFDTLCDHLREDSRMVVVLNVHAEQARGLEILRLVSERYRIPLLVLADAGDETERVVCLELGADDYILKSTGQREILARIRAATRRLHNAEQQTETAPPQAVHSAAGWRFIPERRELRAPNGADVPLTAAEFGILNVLVQHAGTPLSRDYLSRAVFGRSYHIADRSIDNLVARLRRKLSDSARAPQMIKTARPIGYVFTGFPESSEPDQVWGRTVVEPALPNV